MARLTFRSFWSFMRRAALRKYPVRTNRRRFPRTPLHLGVLEDRTLPAISVSIVGSVVTFTGDVAPDSLTLHRNNAGQLEYSANGSSFTPTLALTAISQVNVDLGGGNDTMTVDLSNGSVFPTSSGVISFVGGIGTDTIAATGGTNYALSGSPTNGTLTVTPGGTVNLSGVEQGNLTGGTAPDLIDCSASSCPVTIHGGGQDDTLIGGSGNDEI